ncbi:MAG: hypothetical protein ACXABK_02670, partial [Candidatus Heimdallarchaeaceae archaeon]
MKYLIHYYFGDRYETFQIGVGLLIRALGHSKKVRTYLIDNNFEWTKGLTKESKLNAQIYQLDE